MFRPAIIGCRRCGDTVTVRERGPVPTYCTKCRSKPKQASKPRPASIVCRHCGSPVDVKPRGPLPTQCRGTCLGPKKKSSEVNRQRDHDISPIARFGAARPPARVSKHRPRPAPQPTSKPGGGKVEVQVTRLDIAAEAQRLATPNYGLHVRMTRLRQAAKTGLWLLAVVAILLLVLIGVQPSSPDFETLTP